MATAAVASADNNDDIDNTAITADMCYIAAFALGERIARILEYIVYRLPAPIMEDNDDTNDNDDEKEVEKVEEEL